MKHKKSILILFVLFQSYILFSQTDYLKFVVDWDKTIGGNKDEYLHDILATKDGGVIVIAETQSYDNGKYSILVKKVSKSGVVKWSKVFGYGRNIVANCAKYTSNGGIVLVGFTESVNDKEDINTFSLKLNNDGEQEWYFEYGNEFCDKPYSCTITPYGDIVILGGSSGAKHDYRGVQSNWIRRINTNGKQIWEKKLPLDCKNQKSISIISDSDGGYFILGNTKTRLNPEKVISDVVRFWWVRKLDKDGYSIWNKEFGKSRNEVAHSFFLSQNGNICVIGEGDMYEHFSYQLDNRGNVHTKKVHDPLSKNFDFYLTHDYEVSPYKFKEFTPTSSANFYYGQELVAVIGENRFSDFYSLGGYIADLNGEKRLSNFRIILQDKKQVGKKIVRSYEGALFIAGEDFHNQTNLGSEIFLKKVSASNSSDQLTKAERLALGAVILGGAAMEGISSVGSSSSSGSDYSNYSTAPNEDKPCYKILDKDENMLSGKITYKIECKNGETEYIGYYPDKGKYSYGFPLQYTPSFEKAVKESCGCY